MDFDECYSIKYEALVGGCVKKLCSWSWWRPKTEACVEGQFECPFSVASAVRCVPRSYFHSFWAGDFSVEQLGSSIVAQRAVDVVSYVN